MPPGKGEEDAAEEGGPRRDRGGRFVAGSDLRTRYAQIAEVLQAADPNRPERVSTRAFDAVRLAHHPSLPSARGLASWLAMSWHAVKDVALSDSRDVIRTYGSRHRGATRPWRDADGAVLALKRVAEALGQDELSLTAYDAFRKRSSAATRELLPTSLQIVRLLGDWNTALARAGLLPSSARSTRTALPVVEAIGLFVHTQGRLPGRAELERFAKDPRWAFSLQRMSEKGWQEWLDEFERWWVHERRHQMPPSSKRRPFAPLDEGDIAVLPQATHAPKGWWKRERVVECVIAYLEDHPDVRSVQQGPYRAWATRRSAEGIWTAAASTLTKYGTLEELEREARRRMEMSA